jgi:hypothetical protein
MTLAFALKNKLGKSDTALAFAKVILLLASARVGLGVMFEVSSNKPFVVILDALVEATVREPNCGPRNMTVPDVGTSWKLLTVIDVIATASA